MFNLQTEALGVDKRPNVVKSLSQFSKMLDRVMKPKEQVTKKSAQIGLGLVQGRVSSSDAAVGSRLEL